MSVILHGKQSARGGGGGFCDIHAAAHGGLKGPGAPSDIRRKQLIPIECYGEADALGFESDQFAERRDDAV